MRTAKIGPDLRLLDFENRPLGLSFLPLPLPSLSFFGSRFISRAVKSKGPLPRSFLLRNQTETLATQAIHLRGLAEPDTDCSTLSKRSDVFPVICQSPQSRSQRPRSFWSPTGIGVGTSSPHIRLLYRNNNNNSLLINKYTKHKLTIIRCQSQRLIWRRSESYNVLLSYNENKN